MEEKELKRLGNRLTVKYLATHCLYWMSYACIWGFGALYLQGKGFTSTSVGIITALGGLISVILQPILASLSEGNGRATVRQLYMSSTACVAVLAALLLLNRRAALIGALFLAISAVNMSGSALLNSLGMEYVNAGIPVNYGLARGTGSTSYAAISVTIGFAVEHFGVDALMFVCLIFSCCLIGLLLTYKSAKKLAGQYGLKGAGAETAEKGGSMLAMLRADKWLTVLLLGFVCVFIGHFMMNTYLINVVERFGGTSSDMGIASACAAVVELPGMMLVNYLLTKTSSARILRISCVVFAVKAAILLFAVNMPIVVISQVCQFASYAFFAPASVYYINEKVPENYKVTGQAALGMATMGLGGALGNLIGGRLLDLFSVVGMVTACVVMILIGGILVFAATKEKKN